MKPASAISLAAKNPERLVAAALAGDRPDIAAEAARAAPPSSWRLVNMTVGMILCGGVASGTIPVREGAIYGLSDASYRNGNSLSSQCCREEASLLSYKRGHIDRWTAAVCDKMATLN